MPSKKVRPDERRRCTRACERCQHRKQRCDGKNPCARCRLQNLHSSCKFPDVDAASSMQSPQQPVRAHTSTIARRTTPVQEVGARSPKDFPPLLQASTTLHHASFPMPLARAPQLITGADRRVVFAGDYSNSGLLQRIRGLIQASNESCTFVDDAALRLLTDEYKEPPAEWIHSTACPGKPSLASTITLVKRYLWATNALMDLFDEHVLMKLIRTWIKELPADDVESDTIFYLILAIGLQVSPDGDDDTAKRYFYYGRYLSSSYLSGRSTIASTQCDVLITYYLLGACQRNAAYIHLGTAVRAAYVLGLHRRDVPALKGGERLWKAIVILDGFMTIAFGKPSSITMKDHKPELDGGYSSSYDLCLIYSRILNQVYGERRLSIDLVEDISTHHRRWPSLLQQGLVTDGIRSTESFESDGFHWPNIGIYHLKEGYYWSILLLTLPYLMDFLSRYVQKRPSSAKGFPDQGPRSSSLSLPARICVHAAINTLELLEDLLKEKTLPRRLPFVVNSVLVSGLIVGISIFGDLDNQYPLEHNLRLVQTLLSRLSADDPSTCEASTTIENLQHACDAYLRARNRQRMERDARQFAGLFGDCRPCKISTLPVTETGRGPTQLSVNTRHISREDGELAAQSIESDDYGFGSSESMTEEASNSRPATIPDAQPSSEFETHQPLEMFHAGSQAENGMVPFDLLSTLDFDAVDPAVGFSSSMGLDEVMDCNTNWDSEYMFPAFDIATYRPV